MIFWIIKTGIHTWNTPGWIFSANIMTLRQRGRLQIPEGSTVPSSNPIIGGGSTDYNESIFFLYANDLCALWDIRCDEFRLTLCSLESWVEFLPLRKFYLHNLCNPDLVNEHNTVSWTDQMTWRNYICLYLVGPCPYTDLIMRNYRHLRKSRLMKCVSVPLRDDYLEPKIQAGLEEIL